MKNEQTIFNKQFIGHGIAYFLMASAFYLLLPTLPQFMVNSLGQGKDKIGYILGIYALASLLFRPVSGRMLDFYNRKYVYLLALALYIVTTQSYYWAGSLLVLFIIRFIHGISWSFITTGGSTMAADLLPPQKRGEGLSYFGLSITLAMAVGPAVGELIMGHFSFQTLVIIGTLVSVVAFILNGSIKYPKNTDTPQKGNDNKVFESKAFPLAFVTLLVCLPYAAVLSFVSVFSKAENLTDNGLFFTLYAVGMILSRLSTSKLISRKGPAYLVMISYVFAISGLFLLTNAYSFIPYITSGFLIGFGNGAILPLFLIMINDLVSDKNRARANATFFVAADIGIGGGSILLGYIAEFWSLRSLFAVSTGIEILSMIIFFSVTVQHYKKVKMSDCAA